MEISRRDALLGATAAAVVTGAITAPLATKAALGGDTDLLALCAEWHGLWDIGRALWTECKRVRAVADAHPNCPPVSGPFEVTEAHWSRFGLNDLYDRANAALTQADAIAQQLFDTPAYTLEGVRAKIGVAHRVWAEFDMEPDQYPPFNELPAIIHADLERLTGEARS